jgi:hypothetical protein
LIDDITISENDTKHTTISLSDMCANEEFSNMKNKYSGDKLRWSLKPVFLKYLLGRGYDAVIYCDNDIYFFDSPEHLFYSLGRESFLLTPHYYNSSPNRAQNWFEANFRVGLYNAGFIGVSKKGIHILDWWRDCCLYNVKKAFWRGMFDDQKYLDLIPVIFDDVKIVKNNGCNLAGWNIDNYEIKHSGNGFFVNNNPLIFIHFAELSIQKFSKPKSILFPQFELYINNLRAYNPNFSFGKKKISFYGIRAYYYYIKWLIVRFFEK